MEFTEEKALEIIEKFQLDKKTVAVWMNRGKSPDKYANEDYVVRVPISDRADLIKADRVISILKMNEINRPVMQELIKAPISDIVQKKSTFTQAELICSVKEINRLKIDIVKSIEKNNQTILKKLIADERIKYYVILRVTMNDNDIKSLSFALNKGAGVDSYVFTRLKDPFAKFAIQLNT